MLGALACTTVPHPALIAVCTDPDVLGAVFYLMAPVVGFNATVEMPALHASSPAFRHSMGIALVGIFGGLQTFGLIGLFIGPVIMAALVTIWREWMMQGTR